MSTVEPNRAHSLFDLTGRVAIVTGGAGLLGYHHGAILAAAGAHLVLLDLAIAKPEMRAEQLQLAHGPECLGLAVDITSETSLTEARDASGAMFEDAALRPSLEGMQTTPVAVLVDKLARLAADFGQAGTDDIAILALRPAGGSNGTGNNHE